MSLPTIVYARQNVYDMAIIIYIYTQQNRLSHLSTVYVYQSCFFFVCYVNLGSKGFDLKSVYILFLPFFPFSIDSESKLVRISYISEDFPNRLNQQARHNYKSSENWRFFALPSLVMAGSIKRTVFLSLGWHFPFQSWPAPRK